MHQHQAATGDATQFERSDDIEAELVKAARSDRHAFLPLYERYVEKVYRFCHLRLGDRAAAQDATSEVFLKAMDRMPGFRGGSFPAWLFAITRNVVSDHYRRDKRSEPLESILHLEDKGRDAEAKAIASLESRAVRAAMQRLTREQREILELQLAGWEDAVIAEALRKSRPAVKMLRLRAMKRLRDVLAAAGWNVRNPD